MRLGILPGRRAGLVETARRAEAAGFGVVSAGDSNAVECFAVPGAVPVYLGVTRPRMAELAGEIADGAIGNSILSPEWLRDVVLPALGRAGRRLDVGAHVWVSLADDEETAVERVRPTLAFFFAAP